MIIANTGKRVPTTDHRPPTTDYYVVSGFDMNEKVAKCAPDYRLPTTDY